MRAGKSAKLSFNLIASGVLLAAGPGVASAQIAFFDPQEGVNMVSLGVGRAPDYMGSNDYQTAVAPIGRYYFSDKRYVQVLGPQVSLNLLNHDVYQLGPQLVYRFKRDSDVDDPVVSRMHEVDSAVEGGLFAAATWKLGSDPRQRVGIRADLQGGSNGSEGTVTANYFHPVTQATVLYVGGGIGYSNDKWARTYYGVRASDAYLFQSLNGAAYKPDGGVNDYRVNFGAIVHLSPNWHLAGGARYQRLRGDAGDSPIVDERGSRNQWIYGVSVGYVWQ